MYVETGSYRKAADTFNRLRAWEGLTVSKSTVQIWVRKYLTEEERVRKFTRNRFPPHEAANIRWCLDGTGKRDEDGIDRFILGIIDHGTRRMLALVALPHGTSKAILEQLFLAVSRFGKPDCIRTDNASVFTSAEFQAAVAGAGIRHEFIPLGKPWKNGRIERFFLTLKEKLNLIRPESLAQLNHRLALFSCWYNEARPHQHLYGWTPIEAWFGIDPYRTRPKEVVRFEVWDGALRGYCLRR